MQIDKDGLRDFLLWVFDHYAKAEAELNAYQAVFLMLKATGAFPELDRLLEKACENPSLKLQQIHRERRETILKFFEDADLDEALRNFMKNWKPTGPVN